MDATTRAIFIQVKRGWKKRKRY